MTDDLDRALRSWGDATDPTTDSLRGADVRAAADLRADEETSSGAASDDHPGSDDHERVADGRDRSRLQRLAPWALAAAALLVVVAAAAIRLDDDDRDRDRVSTDPSTVDPPPDDAAGVRTQVVVESAPGDDTLLTVERVEVVGPEDQLLLSAPLRRGTTLVLDEAVPEGRSTVRITSYQCAPTSRCFAEIDADGTPPASDVIGSTSCDVPFEVGSAPGRVVLRTSPTATSSDCELLPDDAIPVLTNPPEWSLRGRLPWTCGPGGLDRGSQTGSPEVGEAAWQCFLEAAGDDRPMELPATEATGTHDIRYVWWRVDPDASSAIEVFRSPWAGGEGDWTIQRCDEIPRAAIPEREEEAGCTPAEPLSLDLPRLDEATSSPTPDTGDEATGIVPVRIVIEAGDPPVLIDGIAHRWVASVDGTEVASGPILFGLEPPGDVGGVRPAQSALVAEVEAASGAEVDVAWELYACPCPAVGPDGAPVGDATELFDECRTDVVVPTTDEPVVLVSLRSDRAGMAEPTCAADTAADLPELTVPPAWSLREAFDPLCGDDWAASMPADPLYEGAPSPSRDARLCLLRRFQDGARAEMTSAERRDDGTTDELIFRVQPGVVELVRPPEVGSDEPWTRQVCTGLSELPESPWIEATGCGSQEEMPLTPP